ncbi:MAG: ABC transporter permease [Candidatus Cloacimonadales bacterium]|jgi:phospholipid/cholesterol/gamma-HCH transport system permease protein|nr:ABC transporter permease [Candidatus Cloacimonadota bacterium]MDD2650102.1 ABC transporter permease [Candidatus Cloacimonadota bacterium]MDD3502283.1 ABC transporter permease [Candidatus Cloacimonadota bacterium]MDX9977979.1 ABC transporter permease [Candidatus Cloacimonadales bacterium]
MLIGKAINTIGDYVIFSAKVFASLPFIYRRSYETLKQIKKIAIDSVILIFITSIFTGLVTALQASYQSKGFIPKSLIGVLVGKTTMTELAPVLTSLVLTGRIGASIAAEIGTMKVTEQLDAMDVMGVSQYEYLYMPRIVAGVISVPLLTVISLFVSIFSSYIFTIYAYDMSFNIFFDNMRSFFLPLDLWLGISKSFCFGWTITSIACFAGMNTQNGAEGVGRSTTDTVVYSSIGILMMDFIVAKILFGGMII